MQVRTLSREEMRSWAARVCFGSRDPGGKLNSSGLTMLPGAGIGGEVRRPEESLPRAPVLAVPLPWAPGRLCPRLNTYGTADSKKNSFAEYDATISHSTRSGGLDTRVGWSPRDGPLTDLAGVIA